LASVEGESVYKTTFIKHVEAEAVKFLRKRLNSCGSTLNKEAGIGSKLGSDYLYTELDAEANNILLHPHPRFLP